MIWRKPYSQLLSTAVLNSHLKPGRGKPHECKFTLMDCKICILQGILNEMKVINWPVVQLFKRIPTTTNAF